MAVRIGVDVGGTFTDLVLLDEERGTVRVGKTPTTPAAVQRGILEAVDAVASGGLLARGTHFMHGTTVGLNALLERRGATVGLLATRGFRDVLEIRRGDRAAMYDLFWDKPQALVPRRLRLPIDERVLATGEVETPLSEDDVRAAAATFAAEGVTAVAVAFLNAYANGEHERQAARVLREAGFAGEISLSHEVSGEYREYERTTTTVVDAYVRRGMADYLRLLDDGLRERGFAGQALVTRSGGGALRFDEAASRPFETIVSGPVAGVEGAAQLARELGHDRVVTADVGGTSFDASLIVGGRPTVLHQGEVVGLPIQTGWVDVRSIGAGGGSIAVVEAGLLRVGPESAGAEPGPACYGRGGTAATVTDAALVLGMLGEGELAGELRLDRAAAERAIAPLAEALGLDVPATARGILRIATAAMAGAIREITIEQGEDPREVALVPFGGAGPLFLSLLARELGIATVLLPATAGNFSAWGLLGADITRTLARTVVRPLTPAGLTAVAAVADELTARLREHDAAAPGEESVREVRLELRYVGQEHTFTTLVPPALEALADGAALEARFRSEYEGAFGLQMDADVEVLAVRVTLRTALARAERPASPAAPAGDAPPRTVRAWSFAREEWQDFALVERADLGDEGTVAGPAIVLEPTATSYVDAGVRGTVDARTGALILHVEEDR